MIRYPLFLGEMNANSIRLVILRYLNDMSHSVCSVLEESYGLQQIVG
ncbi:hypothetical protein BDI4_590066 [Burkholderia diffusa]|nr:hypothetical protein BDI4_590066 [Burkholderia diffusa]